MSTMRPTWSQASLLSIHHSWVLAPLLAVLLPILVEPTAYTQAWQRAIIEVVSSSSVKVTATDATGNVY
ncbi:hypothetical protein [Hymenobacter terrenus]|uniref:hypothetical protein n=1 Tax=Hymenobacter terrenus TaxID=1629124 RepID=UPI000A6B598E|nr:hypothetical protein [Hymenobacter terrenus]